MEQLQWSAGVSRPRLLGALVARFYCLRVTETPLFLSQTVTVTNKKEKRSGEGGGSRGSEMRGGCVMISEPAGTRRPFGALWLPSCSGGSDDRKPVSSPVAL